MKLKYYLSIGIIAALFVFSNIELKAQNCFLTEANGTNLIEVDSQNGQILSSSPISVNIGGITKVYGMARNPIDDEVYVLYDGGNGLKGFGTIEFTTGLISVINDDINNYRYQTMTFDAEGRCYAMTASFGDSPYLLREIDPDTGTCVQLADLEDLEGRGQALAFNTDDNTIYRCEGGDNSPFFWQTLNMTSYLVQTSSLMTVQLDDNFPYFIAMCYQGSNSFLLVDDNTLYNVNSAGLVSNPRTFNLSGAQISGIVLEELPPVLGCTNLLACNYNESAETEDGSCMFIPDNDACAYCSGETDGTGIIVYDDNDGDGVCNSEDQCEGYDDAQLDGLQDLNGDGEIDCDDLIIQITNQTCYLTEANSTDFHKVEISSGTVLSTATLTASTGGLTEVYGMARNPLNDLIYVLYNAGNGIRGFGVLNPSTNEVIVINGNMNNYQYETMAFGSDGTCYAMTASNDDSPYLLREINVSTGICVELSDLEDIGGFGQAIAFNFEDETLYRCEGGGDPLYYWQSLNMTSYNVATSVVMPSQLNGDFPYSLAMCYNGANGFLLVDDNVIYNVNLSGQISNPSPFALSSPRISGIVLTLNSDEPELGCTNQDACNYDPLAVLDDGSCLIPVIDCTVCNDDNTALELVDADNDGICDANEILGCEDVTACNFDTDATEDDGSCFFGLIFIPETIGAGPAIYSCCVPGPDGYLLADQECANAVVFNNPSCLDVAWDISCQEQYNSCFIGGCTYELALNYDPQALNDSGECEFDFTSTCPGDLNSDGIVNAADLLEFLGAFGFECP